MPRADRLALLVTAIALAGCMRIYPDSELPDVEVEWFDTDCREGTGDVALSLIGIDDLAFREDLVVPCSDTKAVFADVARERYGLEGALRSATGEMLVTDQREIDLRTGLDERVELYFGGFSNARVAWTFDMGASCASLAVDTIVFEFSSSVFPEPAVFQTFCGLSQYFVSLPDGVYTVVARAVTNMTTVAVSPASPEVTVSFDAFSDFGTLVLSPCGSSCP